jgi:hypothetical protein
MIAPVAPLKRIVDMLRPGGTILMGAPNFACIRNRLDLLKGGNPQPHLSDTIPCYAHIREPVARETARWWHEAGGRVVGTGYTDYELRDHLHGKVANTLRAAAGGDWRRVARLWIPSLRTFFYQYVTKERTGDR